MTSFFTGVPALLVAILLPRQCYTQSATNWPPTSKDDLRNALHCWCGQDTSSGSASASSGECTTNADAVALYGDITTWDTSGVSNFGSLMQGADSNWPNFAACNPDVTKWDVSNVATFYKAFENAGGFNRDISGWDISNTAILNEHAFSNMFNDASSMNTQLCGTWYDYWNNGQFGMGNIFGGDCPCTLSTCLVEVCPATATTSNSEEPVEEDLSTTTTWPSCPTKEENSAKAAELAASHRARCAASGMCLNQTEVRAKLVELAAQRQARCTTSGTCATQEQVRAKAVALAAQHQARCAGEPVEEPVESHDH